MTYRPIIAKDRTVIQQGLATMTKDYAHEQMTKPMLGVILDVFPIDVDENRSAQQSTIRKGHSHECTVLVVDDGTAAYTTLRNVIITPDSPSGLDDFQERLPRASSSLVTGQEFDPNLHGIDPYELDGDWCVVAFIGGRVDAPFILRWWPHSRNTFDAATSGKGLDGDHLVQNRRYFRRTNGVESIITSKGDIIFSTTLANSPLTPSEEPAKGRVARTINEDEGGSIRVNIKPTQTLEISFNPQDEGIGTMDAPEPELPQTNPPTQDPQAAEEKPDTYVYADQAQVAIVAPDVITLEAEKIYHGAVASEETDPVVLGEQLRTWLTDVCLVLSPFGPLKIDPTTTATPFDPTQSIKSFVE